MAEIPLYKLKEGECGIVISVGSDAEEEVQKEEKKQNAAIEQRLTDLGIVPGTRIRCLYRSPLQDPTAYEIRGAVIALRKEDSGEILVEPAAAEAEDGGAESVHRERTITLALAGNPNVGKSTVFNTLTGLRQHTGNWAGKTVERANGTWSMGGRKIKLVDIPGCYSLDSRSPEEEVSRDFLQSGSCDGVIVVCDGTCLERNLILVLQILQLTPHVAVCINMMDQVRQRGLQVDGKRLSELLGIPVCMTESRKPKEMRAALEHLLEDGNWRKEREEPAASELVKSPQQLVREAEIIAGKVVCRDHEKKDRSRTIDRVLTRPVTGFAAMAVLLLVVFWITIKGANYPSELLSQLLFSLEQPLYDLLRQGIGLPAMVCEMIACGMYRVLAWVVSVMLPPMAIFFPLFTLLEDWGFLPRIAFNLDRCFHCCRACGKQALTMCMGFGCNASAVVGCRIIDSRRERLLAMITNSLVPCNGRFPLLICLISLFFCGGDSGGLKAALLLTAVVLTGIAATFLLSKILSHTLLRGETSSFTLELPAFRRPQFGKVIVRSILDRTLFVLARAVSVAAPAGLLIWILANIPVALPDAGTAGFGIVSGTEGSLLTLAAGWLDPLGQLMGMDGVILLAFLLGLPANEIVLPVIMMIYMNQGTLTEITDMSFFYELLVEHGWTGLTALNVMLFSLMHWPCATTILSIRKESGSWRWAAAAVAAPLALGGLICMATTAVACKIF